MCESLSLNRWADNGRVHMYQRAVSDEAGHFFTVNIPRNPGAAILRNARLEESPTNRTTTRSMLTRTVTLDDLAREHGWLRPMVPGASIALLKIDVEGAEPQVFAGAKALLRSRNVKNILAELRDYSKPPASHITELLLESGYCIVIDAREPSERLGKEATIADLREMQAAMEQRKMPLVDLWF